MRRLLSIGALTLMMFSALLLTDHVIAARAASNPGNLTLSATEYASQGCALGPAFTFCDQAPGTQGEWATFSVTPTAAVNGVTVSIAAVPGLSANFAAGDFNVTTTPPPNVVSTGVPCTGNLAANQSCTFFVAFSPTAAGLRQAQITVADSAGDSLVVNVEGTGTQLALAPPAPANCTPAVLPDDAYTYCPQPINPTAPTTETFTLSSATGATGVNVTLAAIPGLESEFSSGDFTFKTPVCPATIAAAGTCSIGVAFTPTAAGLRSAALIATDSSGESTSLYLAGAASSGLGFTSLAPGDTTPCGMTNHFLFCNLPAGGMSPATTITLENSSATQVTGLAVPKGSAIAQGATAPDFTVQNTSCSSVLAPGATCNINVAFTPTKAGLRQGAIVITDAQGDVAAVNLAGVGDDYSIATQLPTEVSVIPGGTATFNATLTPDNVLGMNGEQVTFVCPANLPDNTSCVVTPCPAMITPGTPVSVKVTLVTSSATVVASRPPSGCSAYGPSVAALMRTPMAGQRTPPAAEAATSRGSPLYPALWILGGLATIGSLWAGFAWRKRLPLVFACAGVAAVILTGCHHHAPLATTATPIGATNLTILGNAADANGNTLNTSRSFQVTLDVVSK